MINHGDDPAMRFRKQSLFMNGVGTEDKMVG